MSQGRTVLQVLPLFLCKLQRRHKALKFFGGKGAVLHWLYILRGPSLPHSPTHSTVQYITIHPSPSALQRPKYHICSMNTAVFGRKTKIATRIPTPTNQPTNHYHQTSGRTEFWIPEIESLGVRQSLLGNCWDVWKNGRVLKKPPVNKLGLVWFGLVSLFFNRISNFVGYSMPKSSFVEEFGYWSCMKEFSLYIYQPSPHARAGCDSF